MKTEPGWEVAEKTEPVKGNYKTMLVLTFLIFSFSSPAGYGKIK